MESRVTETLSDHRYIRIVIDEKTETNRIHRGKIFPRWSIKGIDKDWFTTSIMYGEWLSERRIGELIERREVEVAERLIKRIITDACNNSMRRDKGGREMRGRIYWWSTEVSEIRGRCNMWSRRLCRAKSRKNPERETRLAGELKK